MSHRAPPETPGSIRSTKRAADSQRVLVTPDIHAFGSGLRHPGKSSFSIPLQLGNPPDSKSRPYEGPPVHGVHGLYVHPMISVGGGTRQAQGTSGRWLAEHETRGANCSTVTSHGMSGCLRSTTPSIRRLQHSRLGVRIGATPATLIISYGGKTSVMILCLRVRHALENGGGIARAMKMSMLGQQQPPRVDRSVGDPSPAGAACAGSQEYPQPTAPPPPPRWGQPREDLLKSLGYRRRKRHEVTCRRRPRKPPETPGRTRASPPPRASS